MSDEEQIDKLIENYGVAYHQWCKDPAERWADVESVERTLRQKIRSIIAERDALKAALAFGMQND